MRSFLRYLRQSARDRLPASRHFEVVGRSVALSSVLVTALYLGCQGLVGLDPLELAVFDRWVQLQPEAKPDPRLLLVTIDEADLHHYGWPLSDDRLAQALRQIQIHQPRVIGLDLYRDLPHPPGETALAIQLQAANVIGITDVGSGIAGPPGVPAMRIGFNDLVLDGDGVVRRNLLLVAAPEQDYYSFALRVSLAALPPPNLAVRYTPETLFLGETAIAPLAPTAGGYHQADTRGYQILLHYRTQRAVAPTVTLTEVLTGKVNPDWVRDRVVLIGTTAPSLKDQFYTPYSPSQQHQFQLSGVMIHAQMVSQLLDILTGTPRQFRFWSQGQELLWFWGWTVVAGGLVWCLREPLRLGLAALLGLSLIAGTGAILFSHLIWIPVAAPALGFLATMGLVMAQRLRYTTTRDHLTGLLNREAFVEQVGRLLTGQSQRPGSLPLGVLALTIARFQRIQASLEAPGGDRLLLQFVDRLRTLLPRSAAIARIGEAEFAVSLPGDSTMLTALATQFQSRLTEPFLIRQKPITVTAILGIALSQVDYQYTPENLLRDARTAMYRAQSLGKAHYEVFATGMQEAVVAQLAMESELRQGITAQEFVLYYQPIISLSTGAIVGFEALVRWQHPTKGFVPPLAFIPLAEETGLIIPLGYWICQAACQQAQQWQAQFPERSLLLSINLSSRQFEQPDLTDHLAQIIAETGVAGWPLKFEITESMVMGNIETAIDRMLRIKALGCQLGLDDFGTGYSSLSYLRRFPVDTLKVDKSFVQKMGESHEDAEIVRMIVNLGHILGMDVIAEGVETQADADRLRSLNCDFGQGYFWAKPLPADQATDLLQNS